MAPEVVLRKLTLLRSWIADLAIYRGADRELVSREHYKLERLMELIITAASDVVTHLLAERGEVPTSYRDSFVRAGKRGLLPEDLAERLQQAAGMRNILVHLYDEIDLTIVRDSIGPLVADGQQLVSLLSPFAGEPGSGPATME